MPILTPQPHWVDWWGFKLWASAGGQQHEIVIDKEDKVEIVIDYCGMGISKHRYHLYGKHTKVSPSYGRIWIDHIKKVAPELVESIDIEGFEGGILLEYFRVERSPHHIHPHDMLYMSKAIGNGGWHEHFDIYIVLDEFIEGLIDALRYMHENPSQDYDPPDIQAVEEVAELIKRLDKRKFERFDIGQA